MECDSVGPRHGTNTTSSPVSMTSDFRKIDMNQQNWPLNSIKLQYHPNPTLFDATTVCNSGQGCFSDNPNSLMNHPNDNTTILTPLTLQSSSCQKDDQREEMFILKRVSVMRCEDNNDIVFCSLSTLDELDEQSHLEDLPDDLSSIFDDIN